MKMELLLVVAVEAVAEHVGGHLHEPVHRREGVGLAVLVPELHALVDVALRRGVAVVGHPVGRIAAGVLGHHGVEREEQRPRLRAAVRSLVQRPRGEGPRRRAEEQEGERDQGREGDVSRFASDGQRRHAEHVEPLDASRAGPAFRLRRLLLRGPHGRRGQARADHRAAGRDRALGRRAQPRRGRGARGRHPRGGQARERQGHPRRRGRLPGRRAGRPRARPGAHRRRARLARPARLRARGRDHLVRADRGRAGRRPPALLPRAPRRRAARERRGHDGAGDHAAVRPRARAARQDRRRHGGRDGAGANAGRTRSFASRRGVTA